MTAEKETPAPAQPNAQAILAVAVDRNGPDNRTSDALQRLRGEEPEPGLSRRSAAE
jgi:hypothetical protein